MLLWLANLDFAGGDGEVDNTPPPIPQGGYNQRRKSLVPIFLTLVALLGIR